jgi:GMP synthase-like glutamine amidotransferase|tara:strand:+ start:920 stop:1645 length:726 start_codon:yes stop_codon:yes gene_type:complete
MNKEILIFQHSDIVTAGYLLDLLEKDEIFLTTVRLDKKDKIPNNLEKFHAMICLGGEMNTNMEDTYPWILDEKEAIKKFVIEMRKPYLGICLGAQLLGEVLGGKIVRTKPPEIGILNIEMFANHLKDKVFRNFDSKFKVLQWHSYEVQDLESVKNVFLLASSESTKYQIFRYKDYAYGVQFHTEIKEDTISSWSKIPELKAVIESNLGKNALHSLDKEGYKNVKNMKLNTEKLYENFKKIL